MRWMRWMRWMWRKDLEKGDGPVLDEDRKLHNRSQWEKAKCGRHDEVKEELVDEDWEEVKEE